MSDTTRIGNSKGQAFEEQACRYLQRQGLKLVQQNYHCRQGEIDLIMHDGHYLVFIEVRYRRNSRYGSGAESIDRRKQARLIKTASHYLQRQQSSNTQAARFDVISIGPPSTGNGQTDEFLWIKDAFQA